MKTWKGKTKMKLLTKNYYFSLKDTDESFFPNVNVPAFKDIILAVFNLDSTSDWKNPLWTLTDTNVEKLWELCFARYYNTFAFKIVKRFDEGEPSLEEIQNAIQKWFMNFCNAISQSYDYYNTLLTAYASASATLMDDIKATSKNKVKFNDTPQNPNNDSVYEGDNYITHFTATEGETSSPLMTKIMRLKEIQDHFKSVMADWVEYMQKCWLEKGEDDYE